MRLVMAESRPWPEKLCGMPKIPKRKTIRIPMISANFQRRFLFMTKTESKIQDMQRLLSFSLFIGSRDLGHGGLGHFQQRVIRGNAQVKAVVFESHDRSPQSAASDYLVASLQRLQHGRPFFLAALLGEDQQEIENRKNKNQRSDAQPPHPAATGLHR